MPLPRDQAWFAAKRYGYGWGLPLRWQGWAVLTGFIAALIGSSQLAKYSIALYLGLTLLLTALVVWICFKKGEAAKWRWGKD